MYKLARVIIAFALVIFFNSARANCASYSYVSNQLIYTNTVNEESVMVTCPFEIDSQGFDTNPTTFAVLFAKFEMARFLTGFDLIKDQLQVNDVIKLKAGCSGPKPGQSLEVTLDKVMKIDSCSDNNKVLVTIKKTL